jgi:hypothetical protein
VKPLLLQNITDQLLNDKAPHHTVTEPSSASVFPIMATVGVRNVKTPSNMKLIVTQFFKSAKFEIKNQTAASL